MANTSNLEAVLDWSQLRLTNEDKLAFRKAFGVIPGSLTKIIQSKIITDPKSPFFDVFFAAIPTSIDLLCGHIVTDAAQTVHLIQYNQDPSLRFDPGSIIKAFDSGGNVNTKVSKFMEGENTQWGISPRTKAEECIQINTAMIAKVEQYKKTLDTVEQNLKAAIATCKNFSFIL
jgi:hypothetical protein